MIVPDVLRKAGVGHHRTPDLGGVQGNLKISLNYFRALGVWQVMGRAGEKRQQEHFHVSRNHLGLVKMQTLGGT